MARSKTSKVVISLVVAALALGLFLLSRSPEPIPLVRLSGAVPADFIWGVASSAFQSEGGHLDSNGIRSNDTHPDQDRYGNSVDFRHRYREDIALARNMGVNTYRISINWARVEPQKGKLDADELAYYDDVIKAMKEAGIQPIVALDHFVYPGWVDSQGGWSNEQTVTDFVSYARTIASRYHDDVHRWFTFNEAAFNMLGDAAQHKGGGISKVSEHMVSAHRQIYDLIHGLDPGAQVTSNIVWMGDSPISRLLQHWTDRLFLDKIEDKNDLIAFDYYASSFVQVLRAGKHWKWNPDPPGLYRALQILRKRYPDKPLLIAETGMATPNAQPRPDGLRREDVLRDGVYWMQRAHADGDNVIGYMVWSLTDNFEWGSYSPRFGLYTVNVLTDPALTRIPTAAVPAYTQIIRQGGVGPDYLPVIGPPGQ
jgi:beta-glucosidase